MLRIFKSEIKLIKLIGGGSASSVYLIEYKKEKFALKKCTSRWQKKALFEVELLSTLHHKHIISMYAWWETKQKEVCMRLEYFPEGDLFDFIMNTPQGYLSVHKVRRIAKQLLAAVRYLHTLHIIHRDIKPENILVKRVRGPVVKLADFGLAKYVSKEDPRNSLVGSPLYISPEIVRGQEYDYKVDVWALGVTLFAASTGCVPFSTTEKHFDIRKAWVGISEPQDDMLHDFISRFFERVPQKRWSAAKAIKHPFILSQNHFPVSPEESAGKCEEEDEDEDVEDEEEDPDGVGRVRSISRRSPRICSESLSKVS